MSVRFLKDIEFGITPEKRLLLDLYLPDDGTPRPFPLIVWIHGGGWMGGSKDGCYLGNMPESGIAVASISYRLSGEAKFPACIHDCKTAIRWLRAHADEYGFDTERVGVAGHSAGGHLAALVGTSGDVPGLEGDGGYREQSTQVIAACDMCGPTDFWRVDDCPNTLPARGSDDTVYAQLIGGNIEDHPDKVNAANPITYVSSDTPPFLIVHGDKDDVVPLNQSELLHAALVNAGADSALYVGKGVDHGLGGDAIYQAITSFFRNRLKDG